MPDDLSRVLYADDDEDILAVACLALEMVGGLTVTACPGGREAIAAARQARPDLIMLDVMMPAMDGPTTLSQIRADPALRDIPVILLTARVRATEITQYMALGADGVIPKPFDPMTLADTVRQVWREARARAAGEGGACATRETPPAPEGAGGGSRDQRASQPPSTGRTTPVT